MTDQSADSKKEALIAQVKSLRETFDKAHAEALKAQEAFGALKHEISQMQTIADQNVVQFKTQADEQIKSILMEIEHTKREASKQIDQLRTQISDLI